MQNPRTQALLQFLELPNLLNESANNSAARCPSPAPSVHTGLNLDPPHFKTLIIRHGYPLTYGFYKADVVDLNEEEIPIDEVEDAESS